MTEYCTADEKQVINSDGWMYYVRDADEGQVEFGYREYLKDDNRWVEKGVSTLIPVGAIEQIAVAMRHFSDRKEAW